VYQVGINKGSFVWINIISHIKCKKGKFIPLHALKAYRAVTLELHTFLTTALKGGEQ